MIEETNKSKSTDSIHIYDLVMRAVTKLPVKEKEVLMSQMTINQLASLLTSKEQLEQYIQNLVDTLDWFTVLTRAITSVCKAMSESIDGVEDIMLFGRLDDAPLFKLIEPVYPVGLISKAHCFIPICHFI